METQLADARTQYNTLLSAIEQTTPYANTDGSQNLDSIAHRAKDQLDKLQADLQVFCALY